MHFEPAGMPSYRSITVSLVSQYDILTIPEYPPPSDRGSPDPFLSTADTLRLVNSENSVVTVYVPVYPASQFWISYSISPPYPPKALFYFKLFLNGKHIVSWGCGQSDGYKGKTMFNVEPRTDGSWERSVLCFSPESTTKTGHGKGQSPKAGKLPLGNLIEVRVYRAKARKGATTPTPETKPSSRQTPTSSAVK